MKTVQTMCMHPDLPFHVAHSTAGTQKSLLCRQHIPQVSGNLCCSCQKALRTLHKIICDHQQGKVQQLHQVTWCPQWVVFAAKINHQNLKQKAHAAAC